MADNTELKYTNEEPSATTLDEFSAPHSNKEEPELDLPSSAENTNITAEVGEVKCIKLEPELVGIKEEPTNDSTKEFQELPVEIKEEPEVNFPYDGGSCWSPNVVKQEWIDDVTVEDLDVETGSVDPLGSCSDTEKTSGAGNCSKSNEESVGMSQESEEEKPHICDVCGSGFGEKRSLNRHKMTHTGERRHVCNICGSGFSRNDTLKGHMRTHTGERPHACDICGKGFSQNGTLKLHMMTHSGERPHVCDICGSGFKQKGHLRGHMRIHTEEKPHVCAICGSGSKQNIYLRVPIRSRTGERAYACDICDLGLTNRSHLKNYNTEERLYACDVCGLRFKQVVNLKRHKGTHSKTL